MKEKHIEEKRQTALMQIIDLCGCVNLSSHSQMKDAIQGSLAIAESVIYECEFPQSPTGEVKDNELTIADYEEVLKDHKSLVQEIDVLINGKNAAKQASLCDIVSQVRNEKIKSVKDNTVEDEYEPYMGWCNVEGCEGEGANGGGCWRETGYWTVCSKHSADFRAGKPQPQMKQSAIDRESTRGEDGMLPQRAYVERSVATEDDSSTKAGNIKTENTRVIEYLKGKLEKYRGIFVRQAITDWIKELEGKSKLQQ